MKFGFSKWSIVPVRAEAKEQSEMVTQLLFGDTFTVLAEKPKWIQIQNFQDNYTGWIDRLLFFEITETEFNFLNQADIIFTTEVVSQILVNNIQLYLVSGSIIHKTYPLGFTLDIDYKFTKTNINASRESIVALANQYLGSPYLWGGKTPFGIDCSGFSQTIYKMIGHSIPRDASEQVTLGKSRNFIDEALPGDLAFFDNDEGRVIHVGIVLENKKIIHASGHVRIDTLDHQGIYNTELKIYTHKLRVIQNLFID
ncbi:MAG: C40 family peptidase [Bacteroidales bacterium]|nr:C40 family peptidase [Bacteroidales bacterium]